MDGGRHRFFRFQTAPLGKKAVLKRQGWKNRIINAEFEKYGIYLCLRPFERCFSDGLRYNTAYFYTQISRT
ncbi:hypothetical protein BWD08_07305 [Neisseria animaloris]|nr:hypothetical protein BWD08_07305 [Neisseria animaloris]